MVVLLILLVTERRYIVILLTSKFHPPLTKTCFENRSALILKHDKCTLTAEIFSFDEGQRVEGAAGWNKSLIFQFPYE